MSRDYPPSLPTTFLQRLKAIFVAPRPETADTPTADSGKEESSSPFPEPQGLLKLLQNDKLSREYFARKKARERAARQSSGKASDAAYDRRDDASSGRRREDDSGSALYSPSSPFSSSDDCGSSGSGSSGADC